MTQRPESVSGLPPPPSQTQVTHSVGPHGGNMVGIPVTFEKLNDIPVYAVHQTGGAPIPVLSGSSPVLMPNIPAAPIEPAVVAPVPPVPEQPRHVLRTEPPKPKPTYTPAPLPKPIEKPPDVPKLKMEPEPKPIEKEKENPVVHHDEPEGPVYSSVLPTTFHPFGKVTTVVKPLGTEDPEVPKLKEELEVTKRSLEESRKKITRESETRTVAMENPPKEKKETEEKRSPTEQELRDALGDVNAKFTETVEATRLALAAAGVHMASYLQGTRDEGTRKASKMQESTRNAITSALDAVRYGGEAIIQSAEKLKDKFK